MKSKVEIKERILQWEGRIGFLRQFPYPEGNQEVIDSYRDGINVLKWVLDEEEEEEE